MSGLGTTKSQVNTEVNCVNWFLSSMKVASLPKKIKQGCRGGGVWRGGGGGARADKT